MGYSLNDEIMPYHIISKRRIIKPRIEKSKTEQTKRSKDNAEVFTPSWIVNKQNNLVDNAWFGMNNIFNIENEDNTWTSTDKVIFLEDKNWKDYVDDIRLEVCCGEAPYLVSRYDTVTGEKIKIKNRMGLLDRKFRVINENVTDDKIEFEKCDGDKIINNNAAKIIYESLYSKLIIFESNKETLKNQIENENSEVLSKYQNYDKK